MLTKKQKAILDFIVSHMKEYDVAPSYREIAEAVGLSSPSTIHQHIENLKTKGYLNSSEERQPVSLNTAVKQFTKAIELPLLGLITAGAPIEAVQSNETFAVPTRLIRDEANSYVLRVKGNSMIEDGILDGDYVVVQRNPSPKNGDVVVALLDNAYATLKRFHREQNRIRLQPANKTMKPIYVKDVIIQGVVRAVIRQFSPV